MHRRESYPDGTVKVIELTAAEIAAVDKDRKQSRAETDARQVNNKELTELHQLLRDGSPTPPQVLRMMRLERGL
jgi:hypothetical protein